ncbi:hypothetical protein RIF29_39336 [Crotalaria pallida]|uniref:EF-hand domain-containing protein n=1 Tax=Crotalaria pallida TaxID=3830 RepID=A0AAN9E125_CROPI
MEAADVDGNGSIDYIEFISATMHRHRLERDEHLYKAFQYFDKDSSGQGKKELTRTDVLYVLLAVVLHLATGLLKLEDLKEGKKGILSIDADIFEVTPSFHSVEVKKSDGDTLEYQKILNEEMSPAPHDQLFGFGKVTNKSNRNSQSNNNRHMTSRKNSHSNN